MTRPTASTTGAQRDENADDGTTLSRRSMLAGVGTALLAAGADTGAASPDASGQVGTGGQPIELVFTAAIDGGLTGGDEMTDLTGDGLAVKAGSLSAANAGLTVTDGETTVENVGGISFDGEITVTETDAGVMVER